MDDWLARLDELERKVAAAPWTPSEYLKRYPEPDSPSITIISDPPDGRPSFVGDARAGLHGGDDDTRNHARFLIEMRNHARELIDAAKAQYSNKMNSRVV